MIQYMSVHIFACYTSRTAEPICFIFFTEGGILKCVNICQAGITTVDTLPDDIHAFLGISHVTHYRFIGVKNF
jgi:hypothetical protein